MTSGYLWRLRHAPIHPPLREYININVFAYPNLNKELLFYDENDDDGSGETME